MFKRLKTISMLLFLVCASVGTGFAAPKSNTTNSTDMQQRGVCTGIVKDASGETVIGASVIIKATTHGVVTDLDGTFALDNVTEGDIIQISCIGYATQEVRWNGGGA